MSASTTTGTTVAQYDSDTDSFTEYLMSNIHRNSKDPKLFYAPVVDAAVNLMTHLLQPNAPTAGKTHSQRIACQIARGSAEASLATAKSYLTTVLTAKTSASQAGWEDLENGPKSDPEIRRLADVCHMLNNTIKTLSNVCKNTHETANASIRGLIMGTCIHRHREQELQDDLNLAVQGRLTAINKAKGILTQQRDIHAEQLSQVIRAKNQVPEHQKEENSPPPTRWELSCGNCTRLHIRLKDVHPRDYDFVTRMGIANNQVTCICGNIIQLSEENWIAT